uniref:Putative AC transposase n=1 Tax=Noccaea caerulescens TaxID=107243 RepID=A0A1J3FGR6_NOCCA
MYIRRKEELKNWITTNKHRVSLTTDIWVAQVTGANDMVIFFSLHVIDRNWHLKKLIIGFKNVSDHKGETISTVLLECLADWGIEKVFCITVDNATANTSALKKFRRAFNLGSDEAFVFDGKFLHMRCCAHIINLIAKEGLADLCENVNAIRNAIVYVSSSEAAGF